MVKEIEKTRKDILVLYLSLDTEPENWLKAAGEHDILANQYLLANDFKNPFASYMVLQGIPRYVLIDENGLIKNWGLLFLSLDEIKKTF